MELMYAQTLERAAEVVPSRATDFSVTVIICRELACLPACASMLCLLPYDFREVTGVPRALFSSSEKWG